MSEMPEWFNIAVLMQDMSRTLPPDWDHTPDFWLGAVQCLAEAITDLRGEVSDDRLAALFGAGGLMVAQAVRQSKASDLTDALFARVKGGQANG